MFHKLTSGPILRHLITHAPGAPILEAESGLRGEVSLWDFLQHMRDRGALDRFIPSAAADLVGARDAGQLGKPLEADEGFAFLQAWNGFLGDGPGIPMREEVAAVLCAPVLRMIEGQFVMLVTKAKNANGPVRPRHLDQRLDLATAELRLHRAEAELASALRAGDTHGFGLGARTAREAPGAAKVVYRSSRPVILVRRPQAQHAWHEVELREKALEVEFEPAL